MKRGFGALLALCLALVLTACGVRSDDWPYHSYDGPGIAVKLPDDTVQLSAERCGELYPSLDRTADALAADGTETEPVTVNGVALLLETEPEDERTAVCYRITRDFDLYRIQFTVDAELSKRRAAAYLSAAMDSICDSADERADGAIRHDAPAERPAYDPLVLVNRRHALPEGWADALDLVRTPDVFGNPVALERSACKAFLRLQSALDAEGVAIGLDAACRAPDEASSEHTTGLALDLILPPGGEDAVYEQLAGHGFILRYPQGGEYYTGRDFEPGHIRYVGVDAAREIAARRVTLEEYLDRVGGAG